MWFSDSWKKYFSEQLPNYSDKDKLRIVESKLSSLDPLVDIKDIVLLHQQLKLAEKNKAFILHMGECAESFINCFNKSFIQDFYRFFLEASVLVEDSLKLPVIKIGRIAGQFAKPRSNLIEEDNISAFRGEIINGFTKNINVRKINPHRMILAYCSSKKALNYLTDFYKHTLKNNNVNKKEKENFLFTSHEALLLNYESALTKKVENLGYYNLSAHMVWLGARTSAIDSPHVEYIRGINNPIAVKVHNKMSPSCLIKLINVLNPQNLTGKIVLIIRLNNDDLKNLFPLYIKAIQKLNLNLSYICDPMHANTQLFNNYKVRYFNILIENIKTFINICTTNNIIPQGIHLEAMHLNVTECIGGISNEIKKEDISRNYQTTCDPRLNKTQTMELIAKTIFFMQN